MYGLRPLFQQFHAHIRALLRRQYGSEIVKVGAPYPQNLAEIYIGSSYSDMHGAWAINYPYPATPLPNITVGLLNRRLNSAEKIFQTAAEYFRSIGMPQLPE